MTQEQLQAWLKIKTHFERIQQTDNWYYRRAVMILQGKPDPLNGGPDFAGEEPTDS